jgi:acid phosphatase type 7
VGTGGRSNYPVLWRLRRSVVVNDEVFGVLRLTLRPEAYEWQFLAVPGSSFRDRGSARCR